MSEFNIKNFVGRVANETWEWAGKNSETFHRDIHVVLDRFAEELTTYLAARDEEIGRLKSESTGFQHENSLLRSTIRSLEPNSELAERYARELDEIGKTMGCDHKDDGYMRCVTDTLNERDCLRSQLAEAREVIRSHGRHLGRCKAFPATSEDQIIRDCTCGLAAWLAKGESK